MIPAWAFEQADGLLAELVAKSRIWGDELQDLRLEIARALGSAAEGWAE